MSALKWVEENTWVKSEKELREIVNNHYYAQTFEFYDNGLEKSFKVVSARTTAAGLDTVIANTSENEDFIECRISRWTWCFDEKGPYFWISAYLK